MTATDWRKRAQVAARETAVELELPSGMKILARRPNALQMAAWGRLPLGLASAASGAAAEASVEEAGEIAGFLRDVLVYCCVEPRVSLEPKGEDEIHPREIPAEDWTFIVSWAMRVEEARALEGFRRGGADVGGGGDGKDVLVAAV